MSERYRTTIKSPIGDLWMVIADGALELMDFDDDDNGRLQAFMARHYPDGLPPLGNDTTGLSGKMMAYFEGELGAIDTLPAKPRGTDFQQLVWHELRMIPCGQTIRYRDLAARIGRPRAVRAAGTANGSNPVSIVISCHRVIGSDGSLTGYGGGLHRKRWLLEHEGVTDLAPAATNS